jgi:hypothetical protein
MSENQVLAEGAGSEGGTAPGQAATATAGRRIALAVYHWALAAFLLLGAAQIFLAGLGVFRVFQHVHHAFAPHQLVGFIMGGVAMLILGAALAGRPGRAAVIWSLVLVVQTSFAQSLLAGLADDHALYGGLHAFDGVAALGIAAWLWVRSRPGRPGRPQPSR